MCACLWLRIGGYELHTYEQSIGLKPEKEASGWIHTLKSKGLQEDDYWSMYITSFYWVMTTFSSVGYGEVTGLSQLEM